jgi:hypothetical protein
MPIAFVPRRRRLRRVVGLILLALVASTGCRSMWNRVREQERNFAISSARTQAQRGNCAEALTSLDRAQARLDLGPYARESTLARTRCYEVLGLEELARGHRRLIADFYTNEPQALPAADGSSVFRVTGVDPSAYESPPSMLKFQQPRYSPYASRSRIVGRVVVSFQLAGNGEPTKLRVLEMPHPLLATWAMESVAAARPRKGADPSNLMPGGQYIATFSFEWRWAEGEQEEE